jgi:type III pantothenate kinase
MYILGDIGNSETKVYLVNSKSKIVKNINFSSKKINNVILSKKFKFLVKDFKSVKKILFCSVVPKSFNLIKRYLTKKMKKKCYEVKDLKLKSLINIKVNFKQVGSDRLTNAISLINSKDNFIILDIGTATTFDVVTKKDYRGGIIAPGIKISLNTLSDKASLIPKINLKQIKKVIGIDTISAVRSGFFWGYAGLIDNIINLIKKETGKSFKLVITGGFSDLFKNSIKTKFKQNKEITIKGLIKISKLIN